jgi:hypothetical protein
MAKPSMKRNLDEFYSENLASMEANQNPEVVKRSKDFGAKMAKGNL